MRSTKQLSVTLPNDMAEGVRSRVESGEYASDSEVVREGLRALAERERAVEHWLRTEVVASYDAWKANPGGGSTVEEVRDMLRRVRDEEDRKG